jgi:hypothetical protein
MPAGFAHDVRQSDIDLANNVVDASRLMVRFPGQQGNTFVERCY